MEYDISQEWMSNVSLEKKILNGQLQIVKQAGHLCNLEQPVAFAHLVRTFAKRLNVASRR